MCGIAGYMGGGLKTPAARELLGAMSAAIAHRGPDEAGLHIDGTIGLAHRRLAVVGIVDGQQPMASRDGRLHVTYNGEIFNHVELRADLEQRGHRFRTASDTEVLLHLYDEYGPDCVAHLNGDFAFAIWDKPRQRLFLARDRAGVRPLFHAWRSGRFYFASEVKALLEVPGMEADIDAVALDQLFTLWTPLAPRTIFRGVSELPPAHRMIVENGSSRMERYWDLEFPQAAEQGGAPRNDLAEEVLDRLEDATRIRLRADVEVGTYLSGGLDSSLVSALAARNAPAGMRSFGIGFANAELDESHFQAAMADALGTAHHHVRCSSEEIAAAFPEVIRHAEQPLFRTAPAPLFLLSRKVRDEGLKVVLSGEGADEIFAGYDIFREARLRRFSARQPGSRRRPLLFRRIYPYLDNLQRQTPEYLAQFFGVGAGDLDDPLYSHRPRFRSTGGAKRFFSANLRDGLSGYDAAEELAAMLPSEFSRWHPLSQAQYLETRFLLPGYLLSSQGDRMAMAHGVETRFPFLDHRLMEFAASLPAESKLRGLHDKHILRQAAKGLLPELIRERPKQPYRAPESAAFSDRAAASLEQDLGREALAATGLFDPDSVSRLWQKQARGGLSGFRENMAFIGILSTQLWMRHFSSGGKDPAEPVAIKQQRKECA